MTAIRYELIKKDKKTGARLGNLENHYRAVLRRRKICNFSQPDPIELLSGGNTPAGIYSGVLVGR